MELKVIENSVFNILQKYINNVKDISEVKNKNLREDLGLDSLDIVNIVREIELNLKVSISDETYYNIHTVNDLIIETQQTYYKQHENINR